MTAEPVQEPRQPVPQPVKTEHGVAWQWDYFLTEEDAVAFQKAVEAAGYRCSGARPTRNTLLSPDAPYCVHWHAYSPG